MKLEISDTIDSKGNEEVAALLTVGLSRKKEREYIENLTEEQLKSQSISFQRFVLLLTKEQLKFIISEIEKEEDVIEQEGVPSYVV